MPKAMRGMSAPQNHTDQRRGERLMSQNSTHRMGTVVATSTATPFAMSPAQAGKDCEDSP